MIYNNKIAISPRENLTGLPSEAVLSEGGYIKTGVSPKFRSVVETKKEEDKNKALNKGKKTEARKISLKALKRSYPKFSTTQTQIVEQSSTSTRLDKYLTQNFPHFTRTFLQKLIKNGHILVNHQKMPANYRVKANDEIQINIPQPEAIDTPAENIPLDIVYEDKDIIIINKPAGMVVHPTESGGNTRGTLVNALLHHCKDLSGIGGKLRPGIVHRLDKDTSGLIMVAKNDQAHQFLSNQIKNREVTKIYLGLVKGHLAHKSGAIEAPLARSLADRKKMTISAKKDAKLAITHYKVLQEFTDCSLIEVQIITGRTHQIRVHFASIGHPIIGDKIYGEAKINKLFEKIGLNRQFLHAEKLKIQIPKSKKWQNFEAPLPKDLKKIINYLK